MLGLWLERARVVWRGRVRVVWCGRARVVLPGSGAALAKLVAAMSVLAVAATGAGAATASARPFILRPAAVSTVASAVPAHGPAAGDGNPYGVAVVRRSTGRLVKGDVLVSNFNNAANQQGTGFEHRPDLPGAGPAACSP